jgi:hypothetical protein
MFLLALSRNDDVDSLFRETHCAVTGHFAKQQKSETTPFATGNILGTVSSTTLPRNDAPGQDS